MTSHVAIVFAAANPRSTAQLQLGEEIRRIEQQIARVSPTPRSHRQRWPTCRATALCGLGGALSELLQAAQRASAGCPALQWPRPCHDGLVPYGDDGSDSPVDSQTLKAPGRNTAPLAPRRAERLLRPGPGRGAAGSSTASSACETRSPTFGVRWPSRPRSTVSWPGAFGRGGPSRLAVAWLSAGVRDDAQIPVLLTRPGVVPIRSFDHRSAPTPTPMPASTIRVEALPYRQRAAGPARPAQSHQSAVRDRTPILTLSSRSPRRPPLRSASIAVGGNMQRTAKINLLFTYGLLT